MTKKKLTDKDRENIPSVVGDLIENLTCGGLANRFGIARQSVTDWQRGNVSLSQDKLPSLAIYHSELYGTNPTKNLYQLYKETGREITGDEARYKIEQTSRIDELREARAVGEFRRDYREFAKNQVPFRDEYLGIESRLVQDLRERFLKCGSREERGRFLDKLEEMIEEHSSGGENES